MEFVTGLEDRKVKTLEELEREESVGTEVTVEGMVHSIRDMGEISFVILRSRDGLLQTVIQAGSEKEVLSEIREGQAVRVTGTVFKEERAPHGIEIHLADARILSKLTAVDLIRICDKKFQQVEFLRGQVDLLIFNEDAAALPVKL